MPFFKPNPKTPQELVRSVREAFATLEREGSGRKADKALEEVSKSLSAMKTMLYGTAGKLNFSISIANGQTLDRR